MKILVYGLNYAPELTGIGKYTGEMAEWLAARGHEVRVITTPPYYPDWKVGAGYRAGAYCREQRGGVSVWRAPLWVPVNPGGLKRLIHLASFALSSLPLLLRQVFWRPQLVWVAAPAFFCVPGALVTARLSGAAAWLHVQDYEIDAAFDLGMLKGQRLRRFVLGVEGWLLRRFDRVSTISHKMVERARDKGVAGERIRLFRNWVDTGAITPLTAPSDYRRRLGIPDQAVVALYSGNMGNKQGLEILGEVAIRLRDQPELRFVFCGNGSGREALEQQCAGLANVQFLDLQPLDQLNDLLGLADVHLLPQRADAADLVMPSKLTGMLASGRPVIVTAHAGTELAITVANCGLVVPPEDPAALSAALLSLAGDAAERRRLGIVSRDYAARQLNRDTILASFEADLKLTLQ